MIGLASGALCFLASTSMKRALGYDDSLDVFGVHGVGGFIGPFLLATYLISRGTINSPFSSVPEVGTHFMK